MIGILATKLLNRTSISSPSFLNALDDLRELSTIDVDVESVCVCRRRQNEQRAMKTLVQ
jgi:hypothetical protein